eukprot:COSAG06_NODE_29379_length_557_cov_2.679039_2_plen_51_part_01
MVVLAHAVELPGGPSHGPAVRLVAHHVLKSGYRLSVAFQLDSRLVGLRHLQ